MCLLLLDWSKHDTFKLIVAANRDEFHARPSATAGWWDDHQMILGGRDLEAMGTWMAVNRYGHFAAVTNVRKVTNGGNQSRGKLAVDFLRADHPELSGYFEQLSSTAHEFDGYNFIGFDGKNLGWFNNVECRHKILDAGIYGLSNASLDTEWPKVIRLKAGYANAVGDSTKLESYLFDLLQDKTIAPDHALPQTGIDQELERQLSPIFIEGATYGTRCSTVYTLDKQGIARFVERQFDANRQQLVESREEFEIEVPAA